MPRFTKDWSNALRVRDFKNQLLVSLAALFVTVILTRVFLDYIETRSGTTLPDPLLQLFPPIDSTWITYSFIYSGMLLGIVSLSLQPYAFLLVLRAGIVMALLRIICLFLLPLNPPADLIPLADPFIKLQDFRPVLTRDLFFSWHTATMTLFALSARWRDMKIIFSCAAIIISALLLLQHVQYTIDVVVAPCFAYAAFGIAKWLTLEEVLTLQSKTAGT